MPQVAVVTGGNRGLGQEACRQLASQGWRVVVAARDEAAAQATASALGGGAEGRALDVADPASVRAFADALGRDHEAIHALVNNAGVALDGFDADVVRRTMAVNVHGAAHVTHALLPLLISPANVVMVSSGMGALESMPPKTRARFEDPALDRASLAGHLDAFADAVEAGRHREDGWPSSAYSVSKAALGALTRILARHLEARGVRVNAVCPGWVRTDMGGAGAARSVEEGASGIVWAATLGEDGPTGGFFRDGRPIPW